MAWVSEDQVDEAASRLVTRLDSFLEVMETRERARMTRQRDWEKRRLVWMWAMGYVKDPDKES